MCVIMHFFLEKYLLMLIVLKPLSLVLGMFFHSFSNKRKSQLGLSSVKTQPGYARECTLTFMDIYSHSDFAKMKDSIEGPLPHGTMVLDTVPPAWVYFSLSMAYSFPWRNQPCLHVFIHFHVWRKKKQTNKQKAKRKKSMKITPPFLLLEAFYNAIISTIGARPKLIDFL